MTDLEITVDPELLAKSSSTVSKADPSNTKSTTKPANTSDAEVDDDRILPRIPPNSFLFHVIQFVINHGKYFDFKATNSTLTLTDVGTLLLGNLGVKVDLRLNSIITESNKFVGTLDNHKFKPGEVPAAFRFYVKNCFFTPSDGENIKSIKITQAEFLDIVTLEAKGIVNKEQLALKDLSVFWRFGTLNIQALKMMNALQAIKSMKADQLNGLDNDSPSIPQPPSEGTDFNYSLWTKLSKLAIRVIKEIELKINSIDVYDIPLTSFLEIRPQPLKSITFGVSAKDFSLDLRRLNPNNPAFRLFFSDDDMAHQGILTCSSFMLGLAHGGVQEEIVYIPLITAITKTNIFAKTIQFMKQTMTEQYNTILRANINITTPSISMEPHHVGILSGASFLSTSSRSSSMTDTTSSFQKLWPKAVIKFTIDEPAARVLVHQPEGVGAPIPYAKLSLSEELSGMVVFNCSKVYCDFVSSHTDVRGKPNYNFQCSFQLTTFEAWYRSSEGLRFDFLNTESLSLQLSAAVTPSLSVSISGQANDVKALSIHSEVLYGFREVLHHIKKSQLSRPSDPAIKEKEFFLRKLPAWLTSFKFDISSVTVAVAADELESYISTSRGVQFVLSKFLLHYKSSINHSATIKKKGIDYMSTDFRQLDFCFEGISGYKIMGLYLPSVELHESFLEIPVLKASMTTDRDSLGPLAQCQVTLPTVRIDWDMKLQFMISLCISLVRSALLAEPSAERQTSSSSKAKYVDFVNLSFTTNFIKFKATLPEDVMVMLETNGLSLEKTRESNGNVFARFIRLYTHHPVIPDSWTRFITIRELSVYLKDDISNLKNPAKFDFNEQILVSADGIRFNIVHQLVVYKVLDNLITGFKGAITLMKRALLNKSDYVLELSEKKAIPNIPKIRLKANKILWTLEDDLFESKLALIFQIGLREQRKRLEKLAAFEAKVEAITRSKASHNAETNEKHKLNKKEGHGEETAEPVKASHKHQTGKNDFPKSSPPTFSFIDSLINNKPSERAPGTKSRNCTTFKAFQSSIHPFPVSIRRHQVPKEDNTYKMTDDFDISENASIGVDAARYRLNELFSKTWIKEYSSAEANLKESIENQINSATGLKDVLRPEMVSQERIVEYSPFPYLFFVLLSEVDWFLSKPAMNFSELHDFLFDVGKGLPRDTKFSILVPLYNRLECEAIRIQLRDYPLPLLYFPHLHPSQSQDLPSIKIEGNFVVAEDFSLLESNIRKVLVPTDSLAANFSSGNDDDFGNPFMMLVQRTVSSIKMYTDLKLDINTLNPSIITWCVSMQPAMQAAMQVFDLLSKPPLDPSEKIGFWDKIRSVFHARFTFKWPEGNVHFQLKGSSNPYYIVGESAGFVMCWKNNVEVKFNHDDNPKEFIVVTSNDYVLAVPDLSFQEREYLAKSVDKTGGLACASNFQDGTVFQKVIMKLGGRVKWVAGLLFERKKGVNGRTFEFKPHYDVVLSNPKCVKDLDNYDAYRGFRSDFIHLAITFTSIPENWGNETYMNNYNSIHLSPKFFAHFFKWWQLFDGALSLPVRAGKLFNQGDVEKSKKFGRHLFTVKYKVQLSPLFASHSYIQTHYDNVKKTVSHSSTGLKAKFNELRLDLHQRRAQSAPGKRWKMGLNVGEMDFIGTDLRVLLASFTEKSHEEAIAKNLGYRTSPGSSISNNNSWSSESQFSSGRFNISDNDFSWIDADDYLEIGETTISRSFPNINILPLSYTPRWTYFRQTDHSLSHSSIAPFGNEPSHTCIIGREHAFNTHQDLIQIRMNELDEQLKTNETSLESLEKDFQTFPDTVEIRKRIVEIQDVIAKIKERIGQVASLQKNTGRTSDNVQLAMEHSAHEVSQTMSRRKQSIYFIEDHEESANKPSTLNTEDMSDIQEGSSFSNRFIIHSAQLKWNNAVRNAVFRYLHQVADRRSSAYFLTQKAVRYLDDLMEKQRNRSSSDESVCANEVLLSREALGNIFEGLKSSSHDNLNSEESSTTENNFDDDLRDTNNDDYYATDNYLVRLVSPQIQFVSDKNPDECVVLTSQNVQLKIVNINDKNREVDDESKLIETRYGVSLHDAQFFVLNLEKVKSDSVYTLFSSNSYGCGKVPVWPPWVSIECCYDSTPLKKALVIDKTSVTLRFDKPNSLRVQAGQNSGSLNKNCTAAMIRDENNRQNRLAVDFPKVVATCNSEQYFAMFTIVMDLLIYTEPIQKERSDRLDKILLATDFTNLERAAQRVVQLQQDVRNFHDLGHEFLVHVSDLSHQAILDLALIDVEQDHARQELFVMMEAIKSGMRKVSQDEDTTQLIKWAIGADQVIWHVLDEFHEPILDIGLANASFNRIEGSDGFNANSIEVGMMQAFNLRPESFYPELFSPFLDEGQTCATSGNVVSVNWTMLDPIGGIPIVQQFDIKLSPLKVQIESKTWDLLFNYIFPKRKDGTTVSESPFSVGKTPSDATDLEHEFFSSPESSDDEASSIAESTSESAPSSIFKKPHSSLRKVLPDSASSIFSTSSGSTTTMRQNERLVLNSMNDSQGKSSASSMDITLNRKPTWFQKKKDPLQDELSEMINRASNYLSIVQIRIFSSVACISYKGEGTRNLLDIHEFRLRVPEIQYQNKTWSNMDLVLHLKKDLTKILLSHTGGLIGNKFRRHRKKKNTEKLNQLQDYVSFTSVSDLTGDRSRESTIVDESEENDHKSTLKHSSNLSAPPLTAASRTHSSDYSPGHLASVSEDSSPNASASASIVESSQASIVSKSSHSSKGISRIFTKPRH